jgi:hypothetical protein
MTTSRILLSFITFLLISLFSSAQEPTLKFDAKDLKIGPLGYEVLSTDFNANPNKQMVVTLTASGKIVDIRGRFTEGKNKEEWSVYYKDGLPILAQVKSFRILFLDGEEIGDALGLIKTFLSKEGNFAPQKESYINRLKELQSFAEKKSKESK